MREIQTCKSVGTTIPLVMQLILRKMTYEMEAAHMDCLQVFILSSENGEQKIIHEKEQPDYHKEYVFSGEI